VGGLDPRDGLGVEDVERDHRLCGVRQRGIEVHAVEHDAAEAILTDRRYVVTHGTAFAHAYRERSRLLDHAITEVAHRAD
jgi:hypothetical protein